MKRILLVWLTVLLSATVYAQTTRYVDANGGADAGDCASAGSPCKTITYAVQRAQAGDIVQVAAGTYNTALGESATLTLNKRLTLKGAQADVSPNMPTSDRTLICSETTTLPESILDGVGLVVTAAGVVINGFEILNANIQISASDVTVQYCMITPASTQRAIERTGSGQLTHWLIEENRIGHKNGLTMDAEGFFVQQIDDLRMRRNYVWKADGAFRLINVTNALLEENVVNNGAQWRSNSPPGCSSFSYRGQPKPSVDSDASFFALSIEGACSNLRIERNEFDGVVTDSQAEEGLVRIHASELAGSCVFMNNFFVSSGGLPVIRIPNAYSSYTHNFIVFRENFINGTTPLVDVGTGTPSGSIDANANNWALKKMGDPSTKSANVSGSPNARNAFKTVTYFFLSDGRVSNDQDSLAYGFQSKRQIGYSSSSNTLQEAIDATPADPAERWTLVLSYSEYPGGIFDKAEPSVINRPMILYGFVSGYGTVTLTSSTLSAPLLEVSSDSVTIRRLFLRLTNVATKGISIKGSNQVLLDSIQFQVNNGVADFTHLIIDSDDASASLEQNSVMVTNCNFNATATPNVGQGVAIYNANKGVSGQPLPVYQSIRIENNTFSGNLKYYVFMDGAAGKEVDTDIDIRTNSFNGKLPSAMLDAEKYTLTEKIIDGIDVYNTGYCYFENNTAYVTTNSFYTPYTNTPDLSRAIARLQDGGVVKFLPGNYPHVIVVDKGVTLQPDGNGDFTAAGIDINAPGKELILKGKLTINQSLTLTAGYVRSNYDFVMLRATVVNGGDNGSYVRAKKVWWDLSNGSGLTTVNFPIGEAGQNEYRGLILRNIDGDALLYAETQTIPLPSNAVFGSSVSGTIGTRSWKLVTDLGSITTNGEVEIFFGNGDGVNASNHLYLAAAQAPGFLGTYEALLPATTNTYPIGSVKGAHRTIGSGDAYFILVYSCPAEGPPPTVTTSSQFYDADNQVVYVCSGSSVVLEASINDPTFTYTWQQSNDAIGWTNIPGAEASTYTASQPGYYRYVAQSLCFTVASPPIQLVVPSEPSVVVLDAAGQAVTAPIELFLGNTVNLQLQIRGGNGLEKVLWEPSEGIDNPTGKNVVLTAVRPGSTTYTVTVRYGEGCAVSTTFEVVAIEDYFLPNAFSPNGDGVNDTFKFFGFGVSTLNFRVFNRFGQLVYETNRVEDLMNIGWDGKSLDGQELPGGIYIWELNAKKINGDPITLNGKTTGTLMILR
ncbi:gliding motility-associated-like protein [Thermonema lapsum]|uniref:Gliding motility-associated-like protein n=1 Tax=Thermonema lapsum TaxID=28195 RepID=A0A846MPL8_9BACT|nr:gliding motility-associated C-terminal domain-containing protein [Thermonema lapsum]NIK73484.1 gliding motility-associated-like protein [Thermonema lapsum]